MPLSLRVENAIQHSSYWFWNCHGLYNMRLESRGSCLVFLPDVLENKKYFFLKHLNLYFCVFMIPCIPLRISEANILRIFSFQTKKKEPTDNSILNESSCCLWAQERGGGGAALTALHSSLWGAAPPGCRARHGESWPSSQQVGHLGPALPSSCLPWTCHFISLGHGFLICGI